MMVDNYPRVFQIIRCNVVVANGCVFKNGKCVVAWEGIHKSVVVWDSFADMVAINGQQNSEFKYLD